ncbi:uncharacterized protein KQ657_000529 [Scheffersomyces spartinae]|uniref:Transcription activator GCR1-like domain-containing protein n=1 Tax=Scheffersomyces spartinae TaxID=45513 RepID=A0A9P8AJ57_9ASCO|nr:uncharacterized protein KQ657_000529 [Scheffersomyces spartinae]KAG7193831.1 hypothetical protein KQ657_000529 [Scheffersomyces spartinae]
MSDESFEDSDGSVLKRTSSNSSSSHPLTAQQVPDIHASSPTTTTLLTSTHHPRHILKHHSNILPPPKPSLLGSNVAFAPPLTPLSRPQRDHSRLVESAPPQRLPQPSLSHPQQLHQTSSHGLLNSAFYNDDMSLSRVVNETTPARPTSIADLVSPANHSDTTFNMVQPRPLSNMGNNTGSHSQFSIRHRVPRVSNGVESSVCTRQADGEMGVDEEGDNGGDEAEADGDDDDDDDDEVDTEREQSPMLAAKALTNIIKPKKRKYTTNKNEIKINKRVMASDTPEVIKMFKKFDNEVLSNEEARNKLLVLGFETRKRYITTIKHYIRFCVTKGLKEFLVTGELMKEFYEQQFSISGSDNPIIRLRKMDPAFSKLQEVNNIAYKLNSKHIPNRYIALEFLISKENSSGVDNTSLSDDSAIKRRPGSEHSVSSIEIMRSSSTPPITANTRFTRSAFDIRGTQVPQPRTPLKRETSKLEVQIPGTMIPAPVTPASPAPSTSPASTKESSRLRQSRKSGGINKESGSTNLPVREKKVKGKLRKLDENFMTTVNKAITEINLAISNKHKFINQEIDSLFLNKRLKASDRLDFKLNMNNKLLAMKFEIEDYIAGLKDNLRLRQEKSGNNSEVKIENFGEPDTESDTEEDIENDKNDNDNLDDEADGINEDDEDYEMGHDDSEIRKTTKKIAMNNEIFTIYEILEEWYVVEPTIESRLKNDKLNWVKNEIDLHIFNERKLIIDFIERISVEFDEDRFLLANHCDRYIREKLILDEFISEIELDSVDLFRRIIRYRQGN